MQTAAGAAQSHSLTTLNTRLPRAYSLGNKLQDPLHLRRRLHCYLSTGYMVVPHAYLPVYDPAGDYGPRQEWPAVHAHVCIRSLYRLPIA